MMVRLFHQGKVCDINYRVCSKEEHSAQLWRAERCPSWFQSYKARSRQEESFFKLPTAWKHCLSSSFSPKSLSFPRIHFYQNSISVPATHFYMRMNVGRLLCWVYYFTTVVWLSTEKKKNEGVPKWGNGGKEYHFKPHFSQEDIGEDREFTDTSAFVYPPATFFPLLFQVSWSLPLFVVCFCRTSPLAVV